MLLDIRRQASRQVLFEVAKETDPGKNSARRNAVLAALYLTLDWRRATSSPTKGTLTNLPPPMDHGSNASIPSATLTLCHQTAMDARIDGLDGVATRSIIAVQAKPAVQ